MEGCREEKIFCGFEQRLALKKIYTKLLMGENLQHMQDFSRQKTQYIFQSTLDLIQERRHFFPLGNHPYTKKVEKSHQKTQLFLTLSKTETKTETNKHIPFFPLMDLVLFMQITNSFQKRTVSPTENLLLLFHHDIVRKKQAQSFFINDNALIDS